MNRFRWTVLVVLLALLPLAAAKPGFRDGETAAARTAPADNRLNVLVIMTDD